MKHLVIFTSAILSIMRKITFPFFILDHGSTELFLLARIRITHQRLPTGHCKPGWWNSDDGLHHLFLHFLRPALRSSETGLGGFCILRYLVALSFIRFHNRGSWDPFLWDRLLWNVHPFLWVTTSQFSASRSNQVNLYPSIAHHCWKFRQHRFMVVVRSHSQRQFHQSAILPRLLPWFSTIIPICDIPFLWKVFRRQQFTEQ